MTPNEIYSLAEELNFTVVHEDDGSMILVTGIINEEKRITGLGEDGPGPLEEMMDTLHDFNDEDDEIFDPEDE
jgi:hypothetical protein